MTALVEITPWQLSDMINEMNRLAPEQARGHLIPALNPDKCGNQLELRSPGQRKLALREPIPPTKLPTFPVAVPYNQVATSTVRLNPREDARMEFEDRLKQEGAIISLDVDATVEHLLYHLTPRTAAEFCNSVCRLQVNVPWLDYTSIASDGISLKEVVPEHLLEVVWTSVLCD